MSRRRTIAAVAWLGIAIVLFIALRPGHAGPTAAAKGDGALSHPQVVDTALRRTVAAHARRRLALALALAKVPSHSRWLASWAAAPEAPLAPGSWALEGFGDQTIREIVMVSSGGAAVRIHLSDRYGNRPLVIARASVAVAGSLGRLADAARPVSFGGERAVTIPAGASVTSDPIVLGVHALQRLAISLYLPEATGPLTYHASAAQADFLGGGDHVMDPSAGWTGDVSYSWYVITGVDTLSPRRYAGTVAAVGDSITAGFHSTLDTFGAWPYDLARRLTGVKGTTLGVINEGISGNRLLNSSPCCGPSTLTRLRADVLDQAGVRDVVLLEGTNDIGFSRDHSPSTAPHTTVSAAELIAGDERVIAAAHRAGLKIFGATLLPFRGAAYWTPAGEAVREAFNHWVRFSHAFDGVVDFAATMAAPGHPDVLNPGYDSGDHLHPDNAGYAEMARTVRLAMLTGLAPASRASR